jgi:hypothetical protein
MSVGRVVQGALFCALAIACGERSGDPIVALAPQARAEAGATGDAAGPGAGGDDSGGGASSAGEVGPIGLCGACTSSDDCGDANDACISHDTERFCGRDCNDQSDCPDGYACVELANTQLFQCVPQTSCPAPPVATPALSDIRDYMLARINAERIARDRTPLLASACLDKLAQDSALDFARTDEPLGKYVKECDPVWPNCACGWNGEAEVTVARYGLDWTTAIDRALSTQRDSPSDHFSQAFLNYTATDVGIGFWLSGDEAWLALSFR